MEVDVRRTNVIRFSGVCLDPFLAFHQTFRGKNGDMERENYTDQVIQAVTCLSPNVGGHQQPSERVTDHHPKKVTKNCQGMISKRRGVPEKTKIKIPAGRGACMQTTRQENHNRKHQESSKSAWTMGNIKAGPSKNWFGMVWNRFPAVKFQRWTLPSTTKCWIPCPSHPMLYIIERSIVLIVIKPEQHPTIIPVLQHIYKNMYLLPTCFLMTRKVLQEFAAPIFLKCCNCFGSKDHLSHEKNILLSYILLV